MKYVHPLLCLLLLLLAPPTFSAPPTWYEVEVLVFEHLTSNTTSSEVMPFESPPLLNSERGRGRPPTQNTLADPLPLSPRARKLTDVVQRLNKSSHYRSLLHQAWKQIAVPSQQAQPVYLHLPSTENTPSEAAAFPNKPLGPPLEGTVTLSRGRFLHVALDLRYRQPPKATILPEPEEEDASSSPLLDRHFRLTESRRIRIQELHYFDHPHFGVLVQVRQSTAPEANAPGTPQTFPLEATSPQEMPPEETGEPLRREE